jgi:integrase
MTKLTAKSPATLSLNGDKDRVWFDEDVRGFGIRLREGGSSTWIYRYRHGRQQRSITLGSTAAVPFALARKNAGELEARVRLGHDPMAEKRVARQEIENTFAAVARQFTATKEKEWRPKTRSAVERHLFDYAAGLHGKPITAITQRDVALLLNKIAATSGEITANRARTTYSALWAWAIRQGLPLTNIASNTDKRKEASRDRVLSESELAAIWKACGDDDFGRSIKLLILTGQREAEISQLRWDEVHDDEIILPPDRVKNKRLHAIPLTPLAREIIGPRSNHRSHVFGRSDSGFKGHGNAKARFDKQLDISAWRIHDIRRSVATHMAEQIAIAPHIIEAVLNHVSGHKAGVAGIYNRASYAKEKRQALDLWAGHVTAIVEGRKAVVVPLKRA